MRSRKEREIERARETWGAREHASDTKKYREKRSHRASSTICAISNIRVSRSSATCARRTWRRRSTQSTETTVEIDRNTQKKKKRNQDAKKIPTIFQTSSHLFETMKTQLGPSGTSDTRCRVRIPVCSSSAIAHSLCHESTLHHG